MPAVTTRPSSSARKFVSRSPGGGRTRVAKSLAGKANRLAAIFNTRLRPGAGLPLTFPTLALLRLVFAGALQAHLDMFLDAVSKLCVRPSAQNAYNSGRGVYVAAGEVIEKGQIIGPYLGALLTRSEAEVQRAEKTDGCACHGGALPGACLTTSTPYTLILPPPLLLFYEGRCPGLEKHHADFY
jgi:hypothetical protein